MLMRNQCRHAVWALVAGVALLAAPAAATVARAPSATPSAAETALRPDAFGVIDAPVEFRVQNINRSPVPCAADGNDRVLRGSLVAPVAALQRSRPAIALYLHGRGTGGEAPWRQRSVPGYDTAHELARSGHASLVIDQLSYGSSDVVNGYLVCIGSYADMASQVVRALRGGDYQLAGSAGVAFDRVGLIGHSMGGEIAQVVAYSFPDINALALLSYTDEGPPEAGQELIVNAGPVCARGGEPKRDGAPAGYVHVLQASGLSFFAQGTDPAVKAAVRAAYERDACGELASQPATVETNRDRAGAVSVPVLVLHSSDDPIVPDGAGQRQAQRYTSSPKVEHVVLQDAGHFLMLSPRAAQFRQVLDDWLSRQGL